MPENANAGRPLARSLPLILGLLLIAALGAGAVAMQASAQGAPPEQLSEAELLSRITSAPENAPAFYAAVEVEQTVIPEGLISASEGGDGGPDSGPRNAQIWSDGPEKLRAVLQSDNGDQVFVRNGSEVSVYDGATNTLKTGQKPEESSSEAPEEKAASPEEIDELLAEISPTSVLQVGEEPVRVAGRWAHTLTLEPRDPDSTLVERVEAAVDAETFLPLSLKLYAKGNSEPVASYEAQRFVVGPQPEEQFEFQTPPGAQVETLDPPEDGDRVEDLDENREPQRVASVSEAQELVDFPIRQPADGAVSGRELTEVRVVDSKLVVMTYGTGWGTVVLAQGPERADEPSVEEAREETGDGREELQIPTVDIGGAEAREISTPIGTALSWSANGVTYALKGSVPAADLEEAARSLR